MLQTVFPQLFYRFSGFVSSPQGNATNFPLEPKSKKPVMFQVPKGMLQTPPHYYLTLGFFILCVFRQWFLTLAIPFTAEAILR